MAYYDHWPFWQEGYSAVCAITDNEGFCGQSGNYPYYHTSNDTIANCGAGGPAFSAASMRLFLAAAGHLADPLCVRTAVPTDVTAQPAGNNHIDLAALAGLSYEYAPRRRPDPGPGHLVMRPPTFLTDTTPRRAPTDICPRKDPRYCCRSHDLRRAQTISNCTELPSFAGVETGATPATRPAHPTGRRRSMSTAAAWSRNAHRSTTSPVLARELRRPLVAATTWGDFDLIYGSATITSCARSI
jgi:hypothetical protein